MKLLAKDDVQEALRPIASLISKSEKAQQKLAPGTWQHAMLRANLQALHIASDLMTTDNDHAYHWTREDLFAALQAFQVMIRKTKTAQVRFPPRTSQHTLLRNRIKAFRIAKDLILMESDKR